MPHIEAFSYRDQTLQVEFVESSVVFPGVVCDVYRHPETKERDLGVIYIEAGSHTLPQRVHGGTTTIEGYISGRGRLVVVKPSGERQVFEVGPETGEFSQVIEIGDIMQWQADEDLEAFEICFPPFADGRYENLEDQIL